jgi:energy-coupling factor transport system permease protein
VSVLPQLAQSVQRVRRARRLRGDTSRGLRAVRSIALPVLQDALDRSILLAGAMDSRGYGRRRAVPTTERRLTGALLVAALVALCRGTYQLLTAVGTTVVAVLLLVLGAVLAAAGLALGGRQAQRSRYRPDRWRAAEWLTAACGVTCTAGVVIAGHVDPAGLATSMEPLAVPTLPPIATAGILVAALAAVTSPPPARAPQARPAAPTRGAAR